MHSDAQLHHHVRSVAHSELGHHGTHHIQSEAGDVTYMRLSVPLRQPAYHHVRVADGLHLAEWRGTNDQITLALKVECYDEVYICSKQG